MALTPDERTMIRSLFERIKAQPNVARDAEAEALIGAEMRNNPNAAYVMTQTLMMQEQAMQMNAERIRQLEAEIQTLRQMSPAGQPQGGGFLGSFGAQRPSGPWGQTATPSYPAQPQQAAPWGGQPMPQAPQAGGFMRSALATAAGVAGGALLFNGISNMFGGNHRHEGLMDGQNANASPAQLTDSLGTHATAAEQPYSDPSAGYDSGFDGGDGGDWA